MSPGEPWPSLSERIRATEEKVRALEAAGAPEDAIRVAQGELDALRRIPPGSRIFLEGTSEDAVILGFELAEDPDPKARGPRGAV